MLVHFDFIQSLGFSSSNLDSTQYKTISVGWWRFQRVMTLISWALSSGDDDLQCIGSRSSGRVWPVHNQQMLTRMEISVSAEDVITGDSLSSSAMIDETNRETNESLASHQRVDRQWTNSFIKYLPNCLPGRQELFSRKSNLHIESIFDRCSLMNRPSRTSSVDLIRGSRQRRSSRSAPKTKGKLRREKIVWRVSLGVRVVSTFFDN